MAKPWAPLDVIADNMFRDGGWSSNTVNFTYSFPTTRPSGYSAVTGEGKTFSTFGLEQRSWTQTAMELWSDIVDIEFINLGSGDDGELRLMNTETYDDGTAHAKSPNQSNFGDVWVHSDVVSNFNLGFGTFGFGTLLHEIGHALGLQHPGNYDASEGPSNYEDDALYQQDTLQYTIMSYFGASKTRGDYTITVDGVNYSVDAQTPMLHDIWAMQERYGANMDARGGNTVYGYGSTADRAVYDFAINPFPVLTIWDSGGVDELSLSGADDGVKLDLRPGNFSDALDMKHNIAIAYGTWIENARGGEGNDTVIGNTVDNVLRGLDGVDRLYGDYGEDTLYGGDDRDYLYGEENDDVLDGGDGDDVLSTWTGNDEARGGGDNDEIYGWSGEDTLSGDAGDDYLSGNTGLDTFFGGDGRDTVSFIYSGANWLIELEPDDTAPYAAAHGSAELLHSIEGVEMGDGHDTVYGSAASNALEGGDGNDRLYGYGGNDTLEGGDGNDRFYRTSGNNILLGGAGIDTVDYGQTAFAINVSLHNQFSSQLVVNRPGTSDDQIDTLKQIEVLYATFHDDTVKGASADNNTIDGRSGDDELWGIGGSNELIGGYGDDKFFSGFGNDTLSGGIGADTATYENGAVGVTVNLALNVSQAIAGFGSDRLIGVEGLIGSDFSDWLYGSSSYNALRGGAGSDRLFGYSGDDTLIGDTGNDSMDGGSGDDSLDGGEGHDVLTPGAGRDFVGGWTGADTVNYAGAADGVNVDLDLASDQIVSALEGTDRIRDVESAVGSNAFNDTLRGTSASNKLYGLGGNDLIEARAGNDIVDGGMGYDTASFEGAAGGVQVDLANGLPQNTKGAGVDSFISIEALRGSAFNDVLIGDLVGNRLYGLNGDDWLSGGLGHDWIDGGQGNDLLLGGIGDDTLVGNFGSDTVSYLFSSSGVVVTLTTAMQTTGGAGDDHILSVENVDGSLYADSLSGSIIANHISGFAGNDRLLGFDGADTLRGGNGIDSLFGGNGEDLLFGGVDDDELDGGTGLDTASYEVAASGLRASLLDPGGNTGEAAGDGYVSIENLVGSSFADTLTGDGAANRLQGVDGDDRLEGGSGNDTLSGGLGIDTLIGAGGADRFVFADEAEAPIGIEDRIHGFSTGQGDRIDLSAIDAIEATAADDAFDFIGNAGFSGVAGELRVATPGDDCVVRGDLDGDGTLDFAIRVLDVGNLGAGAFIF